MTTKVQLLEQLDTLNRQLARERNVIVSLNTRLEANKIIITSYEKHFLHLGKNTQSMSEAISSDAHMLTDIRIGRIIQK